MNNNLITRFADYIVGKSTSWSQAFLRGKNMNDIIYGDKVGEPYSQVASVYKAVKAIADNVPQAPLRIYRRSDDQIDDVSSKSKEIKSLLDNPNPLMTGNDFLQFLVGFYSLFGEAFLIKDWANDGGVTVGQIKGSQLPKELWTFKPDLFKAHIVDDELKGWKYNGKTNYAVEQVILLKDFNPNNQLRGLAPTSPISKHINIDFQSLIYNSAFFENFARLGTVLTTDGNLSEAQWERMVAYVDKRSKGASRSFKTAIFEGGLKPHTVGTTHKDMDFIEQAKYTREEILGIWRVPKALFNITDDLNYATFMGQMRVFWLYGIMPILRKVEDALNERLVRLYAPDLYVKFDLTNVPAFQADFQDKVETAQKLFQMGIPMNEINARLQLGFDDIPMGDVSWLPMNLIPSGSHTEPSEPPVEEEKPEKSYGSVKSIEDRNKELQLRVWKAFVLRHDDAEQKIKKRASKYLWEQRDRIIKRVTNQKGLTKEIIRFDIDWGGEREALKRDFSPVIYEAIRQGADFARDMTHAQVEQAILDGKLRSYLSVKIEQLTRVEDWLKGRIELNINEGLKQGFTVDEIAQNLKQFYNDVKPYWTSRIARTEATSALNGGSYTYLDEAGAKEKTWITAVDGFERDSHRALNGQTVKFSDRFANGLLYPADDGEPSEVCNCRCTFITQGI